MLCLLGAVPGGHQGGRWPSATRDAPSRSLRKSRVGPQEPSSNLVTSVLIAGVRSKLVSLEMLCRACATTIGATVDWMLPSRFALRIRLASAAYQIAFCSACRRVPNSGKALREIAAAESEAALERPNRSWRAMRLPQEAPTFFQSASNAARASPDGARSRTCTPRLSFEEKCR